MTAGDLLTLDELAELRRTSTLRGALLVAHAWGVIAAAIALYVWWPSLPALALTALVIGGRQMGLTVLMHEAAHWRLLSRARPNTWVGTWLCAAPVGLDLREYRRRHHLHHRYTQQPHDPDWPLAASFPAAWWPLWRLLLGDLGGITACRRIGRWRPSRDGLARAWREARAPLVTNAALFCALTAVGGWSLYISTWVLPWATWHHLAMRVRDIAEHGMVAAPDDPLRNTRTVCAGPLARALLAPYWAHHHLEHHLCVFVPCWRLPRLRALMLAKGLRTRMEMASSYAAVIRRAAGG